MTQTILINIINLISLIQWWTKYTTWLLESKFRSSISRSCSVSLTFIRVKELEKGFLTMLGVKLGVMVWVGVEVTIRVKFNFRVRFGVRVWIRVRITVGVLVGVRVKVKFRVRFGVRVRVRVSIGDHFFAAPILVSYTLSLTHHHLATAWHILLTAINRETYIDIVPFYSCLSTLSLSLSLTLCLFPSHSFCECVCVLPWSGLLLGSLLSQIKTG